MENGRSSKSYLQPGAPLPELQDALPPQLHRIAGSRTSSFTFTLKVSPAFSSSREKQTPLQPDADWLAVFWLEDALPPELRLCSILKYH